MILPLCVRTNISGSTWKESPIYPTKAFTKELAEQALHWSPMQMTALLPPSKTAGGGVRSKDRQVRDVIRKN